jgi:hypothetical protein
LSDDGDVAANNGNGHLTMSHSHDSQQEALTVTRALAPSAHGSMVPSPIM